VQDYKILLTAIDMQIITIKLFNSKKIKVFMTKILILKLDNLGSLKAYEIKK